MLVLSYFCSYLGSLCGLFANFCICFYKSFVFLCCQLLSLCSYSVSLCCRFELVALYLFVVPVFVVVSHLSILICIPLCLFCSFLSFASLCSCVPLSHPFVCLCVSLCFTPFLSFPISLLLFSISLCSFVYHCDHCDHCESSCGHSIFFSRHFVTLCLVLCLRVSLCRSSGVFAVILL